MPETIDDAIPYAPLTRKQAAFTDAIVASGFEHGSIIAAYRSAYDWDGLDNGASVEAWKLLRNPKITQRLRDAADAQGATTDRLVSGILRRTERTANDQTALNGYELLARIRGMLGSPTVSTPTVQANVLAVGGASGGVLKEILALVGDAGTATGDAASGDAALKD